MKGTNALTEKKMSYAKGRNGRLGTSRTHHNKATAGLSRSPTHNLEKADVHMHRQRGIYSELIADTEQFEDEQDFNDTGSSRVIRGPSVANPVKRSAQPLARTFHHTANLETASLQENMGKKTSTSNAESNHYSQYHATAIEPKVIAPHNPKQGQAPRRIEVERKKRLFAAQDIEVLLKEGGIDYNPPCEHPEVSPTELPLFAFDDHEYEVHSEEQWISLGFDGYNFKGLPAKALDLHDKKWKCCKVLGYSKVSYVEYKQLCNPGSNMVCLAKLDYVHFYLCLMHRTSLPFPFFACFRRCCKALVDGHPLCPKINNKALRLESSKLCGMTRWKKKK